MSTPALARQTNAAAMHGGEREVRAGQGGEGRGLYSLGVGWAREVGLYMLLLLLLPPRGC